MTAFLSKLTNSVEPYLGREALAWLPEASADGPDTLGSRALSRLHRRESERQRNLERIVELASEEMQEDVADDVVAADWLALFFDLAQNAGTDLPQHLWARLLAVQVAIPDAVFKRTLLHLHAMDHWEIEAFAEYCSFAFAFESGWRFVFDETITRPQMWGYVRGNDYTQHFITIGLLASEMATLAAGPSKGLRLRYYENEYELKGMIQPAQGEKSRETAVIGYRRFTVTGQQLTKAIRAKTYYGYARNVVQALAREHDVLLQALDDSPSAAMPSAD